MSRCVLFLALTLVIQAAVGIAFVLWIRRIRRRLLEIAEVFDSNGRIVGWTGSVGLAGEMKDLLTRGRAKVTAAYVMQSRDGLRLEEKEGGEIWLHVRAGKLCASINLGIRSHNSITQRALRAHIDEQL